MIQYKCNQERLQKQTNQRSENKYEKRKRFIRNGYRERSILKNGRVR